MLIIHVKEQEFYDDKKERFFHTKPVRIQMEHSLMSIAKWEAVWKKAYLPTTGVNPGIDGFEEELYYISCMIIGKVSEYIPLVLSQSYSDEIQAYINDKHSATTITRRGGYRPPSRQTITAELIYYWMIKFGIPFECERWHFNRLLMLIDVCNIKENKGKGSKLSSQEVADYRQQLNKARQAGL